MGKVTSLTQFPTLQATLLFLVLVSRTSWPRHMSSWPWRIPRWVIRHSTWDSKLCAQSTRGNILRQSVEKCKCAVCFIQILCLCCRVPLDYRRKGYEDLIQVGSKGSLLMSQSNHFLNIGKSLGCIYYRSHTCLQVNWSIIRQKI